MWRRSQSVDNTGRTTDRLRSAINAYLQFHMWCGSPFYVTIRSSRAPKTISAHPVLHRFCLGPSRLTTNFYQTAVWQCFFTTGKHDPVPTTYPHANVYAIPISRGGSMGAKGAVAPVKPPPPKVQDKAFTCQNFQNACSAIVVILMLSCFVTF